ncbi:MAG: DNA-binding protein [Nitrospirae bacterium]|nr:DNA-binding protein [Nitrospirota bacterium]
MLKRMAVTALVAAILVATGAYETWAQPQQGLRGGGGWGCGRMNQQNTCQGRYQRMYDPQTVETISGTVTAVEQFVPMKGMSSGIHANLRTESGDVSVHLGPAWFIEKQTLKIVTGDNIEVTGSKITFNGAPAIVAAAVKKGNETLTLRNEAGIPVWAGSGMGRGRGPLSR